MEQARYEARPANQGGILITRGMTPSIPVGGLRFKMNEDATFGPSYNPNPQASRSGYDQRPVSQNPGVR